MFKRYPFFLSSRTRLYTVTYKNLFNVGPSDDGDENDEKGIKRPKSIAEVQAEANAKAKKQMFWQKMIDDLAHGDILKYDKITDLPLLACLNKMALEMTFNDTYTNTVLTSGLNLIKR